ncbi:MAG: hypothetical protein ACJ74R_04145 [Gaiellaceae bacterium]
MAEAFARGTPAGIRRAVKRLDKTTLLNLLRLYESAIRELEALRDPGVAGLLQRMERHRAEVILALAETSAA